MAAIAISLSLISAANKAWAELELRPWGPEETSLFGLQAAPGSGWVGNTLTLSFGPLPGYESGDANSFTTRLVNFLPADAIGLQFGASSTLLGLHEHLASAVIEGTELPLNPDEYVFQQATTPRSVQAVTDWGLYIVRQPFDPRLVFTDIPEATSGGVTTVQVFFLSGIKVAPALLIGFNADGSTSSGQRAAGSTTFSDVSWLICSSDCPSPPYLSPPSGVPEPSTLALLGLGLAGLAATRRRKQ